VLVSEIRELFNRHGLRCTRQRLAIYEALCACRSHPTAEALYKQVKPCIGRLSLATVYNTLDALCRTGLVRKLPTASGCCRYEADMCEHLHMRFTDCSDIVDVPEELSEALVQSVPRSVLERIEHAMGVTIDRLSIQLVARRNGTSPGEAPGNGAPGNGAPANGATSNGKAGGH
jgi:Fe2+ or Zn2+ uptake regulation protein